MLIKILSRQVKTYYPNFRVLVYNFKNFPSGSGLDVREGSEKDEEEIEQRMFEHIDHELEIKR